MQTQTSTTPVIENTTTTTYNGWTNYATWRINLELASDFMDSLVQDNEYVGTFAGISDLADAIEQYCIEAMNNGTDEDTLQYGYALAFLNQVNWYEIAKTYGEDNPELITGR